MNQNSKQFYVAGTSALKLNEIEAAIPTTARIVKLPCIERVDENRGKKPAHAKRAQAHSHEKHLKKILDSSEMYCSLITEDFKGCSYNLFSRQNIQLLAVAGTAIAVISLVFGA